MKELSICMTHFNRKQQLLNTLQSIQNQDNAKELTEIIIVDDVSKEALHLNDFADFDLDIKLITIQTKSKWWVNPCVGFNTAFHFINGHRTIIQNAECLHATDIIKYTIDNLKQKEYIAMSALNITQESTFAINKETAPADINTTGANWYCHSEHRDKPFNFCAAVHTEDLKRAGGFDNRFAKGVWFDDDALLLALEQSGVSCRIEDSQLVFHQWHESVWEALPDYAPLLQVNRQLIDNLKQQ